MANYEQVLFDIEKTLHKNKARGASFAIFDEEKIIYSSQIGVAEKNIKNDNKKIDRNITSSTKFMLGDMAKVLTAIAIMKFVEDGKIALTDDIKKYLPEFSIKSRFDDDEITIADLLKNRSGLPSENIEFRCRDKEVTEKELLDYLKEQYLVAPPKMMSSHSELAYILLGKIIEKISEKKYCDFLEENIFKPLDIKVKYVNTYEDYLGYKNELALIDENYYKIDYRRIGKETSTKSNGFISCEDFLKIVRLFIGKNEKSNNVLKLETLKPMTEEPHYESDVQGNLKTGLGLEFSNDYYKIFGNTFGYTNRSKYYESSFIIIPSKNIGALVFVNSIDTNISEKICVDLLKNELGINYEAERTKRQIRYVNCRIEDYAGYYPAYDKQIEIYLGDFLTMKIGDNYYKMLLKENGYFDLFKVDKKRFFSSKEVLERNALIKNNFLTLIDFDNDAIRTNTIGYYCKPTKINEVWKKALGEYRLNSSKRFTGIVSEKMELTIENDFLTMVLCIDGEIKKMTLVSLNDQEAINLGYGDFSNETIFLNLSTIKFNGLSYDKIKESPINKVKIKKVNEEKIIRKNKQKKIDKMFDFKD